MERSIGTSVPSFGWRPVIVVVLVLVAAAILGATFRVSSPDKRITGTIGDHREPAAVRRAAQITDRYDRQVLSLGPVLYLTLGRSSSAIEPDRSGNGHSGVYEPSGQRADLAELPNGDLATVFNGNDQYVQVPSSAALSITDTGRITVEAWIRPAVLQFPHDQGSGYVYILGKGTAGKQEYALRMYSYANSEVPPRPNRISAYAFNLTGGKGSGAYFQDKVEPGAWIMVTFVIDSRHSAEWRSGYIAIYKNGRMRGSPVSLRQFNVTLRASDAPFRIATRDMQSFFEGAIGKVAIYDRILSAQEIRATYKAMISPAGEIMALYVASISWPEKTGINRDLSDRTFEEDSRSRVAMRNGASEASGVTSNWLKLTRSPRLRPFSYIAI